MKIILLQDVGGVGKRGEIKDVADGYALNYLIPRVLAAQGTPEKIAAHEKKIAADAAAREKAGEELARAVRSLEGARIEIWARATEKGGLFKSLGAAEIRKALGNAAIPESAIQFGKPIKETGEHEIAVRAAGAEARVIVAVAAA